MINIRISYDGSTMNHTVAHGTTASQVSANAHVRDYLGLPGNAQAMVNGTQSNAALNEGDVITFISAPTEKA